MICIQDSGTYQLHPARRVDISINMIQITIESTTQYISFQIYAP